MRDPVHKKWIIYHKDTKDTKKSDRLCIICVLCVSVVNKIFSKLGGDRCHQVNQSNDSQICFFLKSIKIIPELLATGKKAIASLITLQLTV